MLISVIVPVYDAEKYLKRCVESIQNQTYSKLEIILVDDGSPDMCPKMCDDFALKDARIKVIHKENSGQGLARNAGLAIATGEYVAFVDSDDWLDIDHIENLYNALQSENADIAIGALSTSDGQSNTEGKHRVKEGFYTGDRLKKNILLATLGPDTDFKQDVEMDSTCCGRLFRRSIIEKNNILYPSERTVVGEDMFFNVLCMHYSSSAVVVKEAGYYYFENQSSTTRKYNPLRYDRTLNFYNNSCELVKACGLSGETGFRVERTFLLKLRTALRLVVISDMTRKQKIVEIRRYLKNKTVKTVLNNYPIKTFIPAIRLLTRFMRGENAVCIYYLIRIREFAKGQNALKKALWVIGIGK